MENKAELESVGDPYKVKLKDGKIVFSESVKLGAGIKEGDEIAVRLFNDYNQILMPDNAYSDEEIKAVLSYIKNESGSEHTTVTVKQMEEEKTIASSSEDESSNDLFSFNDFFVWLLMFVCLLFFVIVMILSQTIRSLTKELQTRKL